MKKNLKRIVLTIGIGALTALAGSPGFANSITTGYDINSLLMQGHPLANRMGTKWRPAVQPQTQTPPPPSYQPAQPAYQPAQPAYQPAPQVQTRQAAQPAASAPARTAPAPAPARMERSGGSRGVIGSWSEKESRASSRGKPLGGILAEVSLGALMHDQGPFSNSKEDGIDTHIEIRFKSPEFLDVIWRPEPHIGANINSQGDTSQVFWGLSYEWLLWKGLFAGFSVGGAYHNGETDSHLPDAKDLGCHLLFRESITLGWEITDHHKIAAVFDHISNAKICDFNEGLENLGVRYSYRF